MKKKIPNPPKLRTKEHYFQVIKHMASLLNKISRDFPESTDDVKELLLGLQIINNEYVLNDHPEFNISCLEGR